MFHSDGGGNIKEKCAKMQSNQHQRKNSHGMSMSGPASGTSGTGGGNSRPKPAVPVKPTNIPPQKFATQTTNVAAATTAATNTTFATNNRTFSTTFDTTTTTTTTTATATNDPNSTTSIPNSPNMSFVNDCCGMLLSSKPQPHSSSNSNNNNHKSTTSSSCSTPQNSCCCTSTIMPVLNYNQQPSSASSLSSHSGGFRDPHATTTTVAVSSPKRQPPAPTTTEATKIQFAQTSKQIEHILAQRLSSSPSPVTTANHKAIGDKPSDKKRSMSCSSNKNASGVAMSHPATTTTASMSKSYHASSSLDSNVINLGDSNMADVATTLQGKLQQEMKKHCRLIQEKHLIERRPPQKHYKAITTEDLIMPTSFSKPNQCQNSAKGSQMVLPQTNPPPPPAPSAAQPTPPTEKVKISSNGKKGYAPQPPTATPTTTTDDNALVYRDGSLISGPLDGLIQHMIPTHDYYPDNSYVFAFLLSARLFIRPHELLSRICEIWEEQQERLLSVDECDDAKTMPAQQLAPNGCAEIEKSLQMTPNGCAEVAPPVTNWRAQKNAQNFTKLLAEWIDTFPYDFRDERLMQHVRAITRKCIQLEPSLSKEISRMLQSFMNRLTVLEKYEEFLQTLVESETTLERTNSTSSTDGGGAQRNSSDESPFYRLHSSSSGHQSDSSTNNSLTNFTTDLEILEMCQSPGNLAHQLTHIELERLSHIGPEEFVQAFAKQNRHLESFSDMKKTRNLESYVQWFNRLSYLVATEIVKHSKKKQRARVVEFWIETARECFNIGNFNSLMAIIAGLNMSPISRLKKTWSKVQPAKFSVLEHQMDPTSNFNSYRSTLKAAMWRSAGATDERERIIIPFFSLLVKDLYFLNEGCSNRLPNGHINFEKFWQLAKQVQEFNTWKKVTCPFDKSQKIIMFLQTNHVLNETTLSMASFECEPPENTQEKDRYKSLKSESKQLAQNQS